MSGDLAGRCWSPYSHVMPGTQEEAAERVDVAPRAAINRRTRDIGQLFVICEGFPPRETARLRSRSAAAVALRSPKSRRRHRRLKQGSGLASEEARQVMVSVGHDNRINRPGRRPSSGHSAPKTPTRSARETSSGRDRLASSIDPYQQAGPG